MIKYKLKKQRERIFFLDRQTLQTENSECRPETKEKKKYFS